MGAPAQQQTPVYYDTTNSQYYTLAPKSNEPSNNVMNSIMQLTGLNPNINRNYLGSPYSSANANRFTTNAQATPYAELTNLFPGLNAGSTQGLMSSTQPDGAMYGAGRFLAPQTTSQSKGK